MPETSTPTLTPDGTTKFPAFKNNNPGNVEVDALKAYILSQAGLANGLATLDENGKLNAAQIPVDLDDVLVYASYASLPATGETGKLYITSDVNGTYYWNGTSYQILNQSFVRYRGSVSSLPSDPQPGDWFIAASSFSIYTSGHIYLYNGSSWDDVTAVFGQFVLKTDIAQTLGQQIDKVPSNKAVDDAINAINTRVTNIEETLMGENEVTVQYPDDGNYSSLMPNKVPLRALKYAEVPTIRGKSRAWNQLVRNGNFADGTTGWATDSASISASDNVLTITPSGGEYSRARRNDVSFISGHKYFIHLEYKKDSAIAVIPLLCAVTGSDVLDTASDAVGAWKSFSFVGSAHATNTNIYVCDARSDTSIVKRYVQNVIVRDLTLIFGSGNEPPTVAEALAQLPALGQYNVYDAGSLVDETLSGARSVGKNIFNISWLLLMNGWSYSDGFYTGQVNADKTNINNKVESLNVYGRRVAVSIKGYNNTASNGLGVSFIYSDGTAETLYLAGTSENTRTKVSDADKTLVSLAITYGSGSVVSYISGMQIEFGIIATEITHYKTDTLSLSTPVSLKSAGSVAEVLTLETGKKTRPIGSYTFSDNDTFTYASTSTSGVYRIATSAIAGLVKIVSVTETANLLIAGYEPRTANQTYSLNMGVCLEGGDILFYDPNYNTASSADAFKAHIKGLTLYYELATPLSDEQVCDPITDPFIQVEGGGTVETIQTQTPVIDNCFDVTYDIIP